MLVVFDWVVALCSEDEVCGYEFCSLMQELEEGVLGVCAGFAEENGAGCVFDVVATAGDGFAVRFHGELLQVGGEAGHVLIEASMLSAQSKAGFLEVVNTHGATRCV